MIQSVQRPWIFARRSLRSEADVGWDGSLLLERTLRKFNGCLREEGRGRSSRFASDMLGSCQRHLLMRGGTHASPLEASPLITKPRCFWPCCGGGGRIYLFSSFKSYLFSHLSDQVILHQDIIQMIGLLFGDNSSSFACCC